MLTLHDVYGTPFQIDAGEGRTLLCAPPTVLFWKRLLELHAMPIGAANADFPTDPNDLEGKLAFVVIAARLLHTAVHIHQDDITFADVQELVSHRPEMLKEFLDQFRRFLPDAKGSKKKSRTSAPRSYQAALPLSRTTGRT